MGTLSIILIIMVLWMVTSFVNKKDKTKEELKRKLSYGRSIGLFALMFGILYQLIIFYQALSLLETVEKVAPSVLFGAFKVGFLTTIYGLIIYVVSLALSHLFTYLLTRKSIE